MMENNIYRKKGSDYIKGTIFKIFLHDDHYNLVDLKVFADGVIDCVGQEINLEMLKHYLNSGKLVCDVPTGKRVYVPYLGHMILSIKLYDADNDHFIGLIEHAIDVLNTNENEIYLDETLRLFRDYLVEPTDEIFQQLEQLYQRIPEDDKAIFEPVRSNDPLIKLMISKQPFTKEERAYMLNDYFDGKYLEMK